MPYGPCATRRWSGRRWCTGGTSSRSCTGGSSRTPCSACCRAGLTVETMDGSAWVGLVPFFLRVGLPGVPSVPWLSRFAETNVRTYVRSRDGARGIWFFSLDAARLGAVVTARATYRIPYFWSKHVDRAHGIEDQVPLPPPLAGPARRPQRRRDRHRRARTSRTSSPSSTTSSPRGGRCSARRGRGSTARWRSTTRGRCTAREPCASTTS